MVNADLAAHILALGKTLAPDKFPQPNPQTTAAWARALDKAYPEDLWADAVILWSTDIVGKGMCTPRQLLQAADATARRWETTPRLKTALDAFRMERMHAKYREMLGDNYTPDSVPPQPTYEIEPATPPNPELITRLKKAIAARQNNETPQT